MIHFLIKWIGSVEIMSDASSEDVKEANYFATFTDVAIIFIRFLPGIKLSVAGGPSNPLQKDRWWGTRLVPLSGALVTD